MAIRRDSLRAQTDFYSPMTGNTGTKIRYAAAPTRQKDTYGSQVKSRLSEIGQTPRRSAPIIKAIKTVMNKTDDPFTQIAEKKSYAPEEENDIGAQIEGLAGQAQDAIGEGVSKVEEFARSTGKRASERRAEQQLKRQQERAADKAETDKKFTSFGQAYRSDLSDFAKTTGARFSDYESSINNLKIDFTGSKAEQAQAMKEFRAGIRSEVALGDQDLRDKLLGIRKDVDSVKTRTYGGQGSSVNKLGATTVRQGGAVKDGKYVGKQERGPAVNVSGSAEANREKQRNLRMAQAQAKRVTPAVKATGIPNQTAVQGGAMSQAARDQAAINRGIAAAKKTGIPNQTAVQGGAMSQAARDQAAINRGVAAAKATGIPSGDALKAGSFGISKEGRLQAAKNKAQAQAKAKAQAAKKTSTVSTTTKQGVQRTKAQMAAAKRKASGTTSSQARAANKTSMKAAAAARHASFKKAKAAGTHARTASAQRARNKAAAKTRAKNAAKARNKRKSRKGKKGKKCDISLKYDISLLTNNNLRHDELAEVAYFVRALKEVEL